MTSLYIMMKGFFLEHVEYMFALPHLEWLPLTREVAIFATGMTALKYGFPIWVLMCVWVGRSLGWRAVAAWVLWLFDLKLLTLLVQIHVGPVWSDAKLYEVIIAEFASVYCLMGLVLAGVAMMAGWERVQARFEM